MDVINLKSGRDNEIVIFLLSLLEILVLLHFQIGRGIRVVSTKKEYY